VHPLPAEELGDAEVGDPLCAPFVEEDVVRFDVAVDDHLLWMYSIPRVTLSAASGAMLNRHRTHFLKNYTVQR
jgi:hypothetical protein